MMGGSKACVESVEDVMSTLAKVSRIMVENCPIKNNTTDSEMNPPVKVLVSASLLNLRNCIEANRSHFLTKFLPVDTNLDMLIFIYFRNILTKSTEAHSIPVSII